MTHCSLCDVRRFVVFISSGSPANRIRWGRRCTRFWPWLTFSAKEKGSDSEEEDDWVYFDFGWPAAKKKALMEMIFSILTVMNLCSQEEGL